jgi:hypothetical protein
MAKVEKMTKRIYKVVTNDEAKAMGASVFSENPYNRFALVAVRGESLDNVIAWAYNRESLERKATERNKDIAMLGKMIGKANEIADKEEAE